eukprot:GHVP01053965.1.p1 GENE.GHVP01053965.1~~GHVP01053965.1.p1  ORF type:complete len:270 (+),score=35.48 GHVP01053965.1:391-1200(+)
MFAKRKVSSTIFFTVLIVIKTIIFAFSRRTTILIDGLSLLMIFSYQLLEIYPIYLQRRLLLLLDIPLLILLLVYNKHTAYYFVYSILLIIILFFKEDSSLSNYFHPFTERHLRVFEKKGRIFNSRISTQSHELSEPCIPAIAIAHFSRLDPDSPSIKPGDLLEVLGVDGPWWQIRKKKDTKKSWLVPSATVMCLHRARVVKNYISKNDDEINVNEGDICEILKEGEIRDEILMILVRDRKSIGLVPNNCLAELLEPYDSNDSSLNYSLK